MPRRTSGFSTIELLIVIAILGILATIGYTRINPPSARLFSNDLKAMIHQARYEAIKRNQPVAFVWDEAAESFYIRLDSNAVGVNAQCDGDSSLVTKQLSEYRQVSVDVSMLTDGIVWLPTGQARSCSGSPMVSSSIEVTSQDIVRRVEITMGGKVTIN